MQAQVRQEVSVFLFALVCACVQGMKIDFTQLKNLRDPFLVSIKRGQTEAANKCPPDAPFLCKTPNECIPLDKICNHHRDCSDGFDENPKLCNAKNRPSVDEIAEFLMRNDRWIIPELFDGADPRMVAHSLAIASDLDDLAKMVGMSAKAEDNFREAFMAVMDADERPLLQMGMPDDQWYNVEYMLNKLRNGGLKV